MAKKEFLTEAVCDNPGESDAELVFKKGDVIKVLETETGSEGWWEGELNGVVGFFPESFVTKPQQKEKKQARALYTYEPADKSTDLPFNEGDLLTVCDIPGSPEWVEAENAKGNSGYAPRNYIELLPDDFKKPDLPTSDSTSPSSYSSTTTTTTTTTSKSSGTPKRKDSDTPPPLSKHSHTLAMAPGGINPVVKLDTIYKIAEDGLWTEKDSKFSVTLTVGEKKTKFRGAKKFTAYTITMSTGSSVERRYKHFDWLHARLKEKFPFIALPSLPEKQLTGRFDASFLEMRRRVLERYLNSCARHPILRSDSIYKFFISEQNDWKQGKRIAEKDSKEFGPKLAELVEVVNHSKFNWETSGEQVSVYKRYVSKLEKYLVAFREAEAALFKARKGNSSELEKIGAKLQNLEVDYCFQPSCVSCAPLARSFGLFKDAYVYELNRDRLDDFSYLGSLCKQYQSYISSMLDVGRSRDGAEGSFQSVHDRHTKLAADPNVETDVNKARQCYELEKQSERLKDVCEVTTSIMQAEIKRFHCDRLEDFREALLTHSVRERDFHKAMMENWDRAIATIEEIQPKPE